MPRISQEKMDQRRQEILQAALACFIRKGFHHTTMTDIFEESGLSAGAVYRYFDSKESLIRAVAERDQQTNESVFRSLAAAPTAREGFRQLVTFYFNMLKEASDQGETKIGLTVAAEAVVNPSLRDAIASARQGLRKALAEFAQTYSDEQFDGRIPGPLLADMLLCVYQGAQMSLAMGEAIDTDALSELLCDMHF